LLDINHCYRMSNHMNARKKNILIIGGFGIFPCNTGGHMRTGNIARALARMGHQVTIYALAGRLDDYRLLRGKRFKLDEIEPNLTQYIHLGLGFGAMQTLGRRLGLPRVWQYWLVRMGRIPSSMTRAIEAADVILSDLPWCPAVGNWPQRKPWYLISHNLEYKLLEQGNRWDRMAVSWMRRVEQNAPMLYRDILACAEEDQEFFRAQAGAASKIIPVVRNGVDPAIYRAAPGVREQVRATLGVTETDHVLIFSGSNFGPNVDALQWLRSFCRAETAFLTQHRIVILVLGSMSTPFRENPIIATGRVQEILPYFAAGDAGLNPITRGSGANVKLFEYLAAQLPVISTPFGVRGTTLQPDRDYLCFEGSTLKQALLRFVTERDRAGWRQHAHQVWQRQKGTCDVEDIMLDLARQLPDFGIQ
jgi:glycosyltransferase involved in cell wall biosynthesis